MVKKIVGVLAFMSLVSCRDNDSNEPLQSETVPNVCMNFESFGLSPLNTPEEELPQTWGLSCWEGFLVKEYSTGSTEKFYPAAYRCDKEIGLNDPYSEFFKKLDTTVCLRENIIAECKTEFSHLFVYKDDRVENFDQKIFQEMCEQDFFGKYKSN